MQEFLTNFHFLRPWYLLLLVLPLLFYWRFFKGFNNHSSWEKVCDKKLLQFLLIKGSSLQRKLVLNLTFWGFITAVLAVSGPSWMKKEVPTLSQENPVMILLNMSSDMSESDLTPSRLERAKYKIQDLLKMLKNVQIGLIVYSDEPFLISPITDDVKLLQNLLPAINFDIMPSNGDRLDRALGLAIDKFVAGGYAKGNIIVFTPDVGQRFNLAIEQAKIAQADDYKISIIEVSTQNNEKLQMLAKDGGGIALALDSNDEDIRKIAQLIDSTQGELKQSKNKQSAWEDFGYYLLVLPMLCCLYFFRRGIFMITLCVFISHNAYAGFFLNNNQEGLKAFNLGDFQKASNKFENPNWKASAQYRLGDYQAALKNFSQTNDITAMYNQGNALAKGGKIEDAIKKYEEVLKLEPEHEDAKFNLEYLKQQQNQQQQQQQQQNQSSQDEKNQEQNSEQQQSEQDYEKGQDKQQNQNKNKEAQDSKSNPQETKPDKGDESQEKQQPQDAKAEQKDVEGEEKEQPAALENGEEDDKYNEEVQAKAQQYREIPEDAGGLLRAFIKKEYNRNRYQEK